MPSISSSSLDTADSRGRTEGALARTSPPLSRCEVLPQGLRHAASKSRSSRSVTSAMQSGRTAGGNASSDPGFSVRQDQRLNGARMLQSNS